jgi:hypothetical protein
MTAQTTTSSTPRPVAVSAWNRDPDSDPVVVATPRWLPRNDARNSEPLAH